MNIPRIMIAAPGSGSGKTFLTCALLQLMKEEGRKVAAFKCGPDYIDPMFHKKIIGVPSKNLDMFFTEEEKTRALFLESAKDKEISVIEGVMGLYDGLGGIREEASSYHLAKAIEVPIVLVINGRGMGRSLLPLIAGFLRYDTEKLIVGVILNKVTKMFYESIKEEIEKELSVAVLGYLPFQQELQVESRHLGLKLPEEVENLQSRMEQAASVLKDTLDIKRLLDLAEGAAVLSDKEDKRKEKIDRGGENSSNTEEAVPIGIAMDEAFCFYYEDNLRLLEEAGARLVPFSPLRDKRLPEGIRGLILGGGYPELYAKELSENGEMKADILYKLKTGMPSIAECGGFMYLHEQVEGEDKRMHPMVGAHPGACRNTGKLVRFGYIVINERESTFLKEDETIKGHEFHYYDSTDNGNDCIATKPISCRNWDCVHISDRNWWGFPHLYYASNPHYPDYFMGRARAYAEEKERK